MRAVVVLPLVPVIAAMGTRAEVPGGNSMSMTGAATSRALAFARRHVHAKAGRRVHFADAAADAAVALGNILREKIHAAHVEADGAHRALGHLAVVGMDDVGDVGGGAAGGKIRGGAQIHHLSRLGNRIGVEVRRARASSAPAHRVPGASAPFRGRRRGADPDSRSRSAARWYAAPSPTTWPGVRRVAATSSPLTTSRR